MPKKSKKDSVFTQSKWYLGNVFRSLDNFGSPIPAFNLKGNKEVTTIAGGLLSATILTLTLAYAV